MRGLQDFNGDWTLSRVIDDRLTGQIGRFDGTAALQTGAPSVLMYHETGKMRFGDAGPEMNAERKYIWTFGADVIAVQFADGAAFHSFVPNGKAPGTAHLCGDDLYNVTYDFCDWPHWSATWNVKGPRKDYTSVSRYAPSEGANILHVQHGSGNK